MVTVHRIADTAEQLSLHFISGYTYQYLYEYIYIFLHAIYMTCNLHAILT